MKNMKKNSNHKLSFSFKFQILWCEYIIQLVLGQAMALVTWPVVSPMYMLRAKWGSRALCNNDRALCTVPICFGQSNNLVIIIYYGRLFYNNVRTIWIARNTFGQCKNVLYNIACTIIDTQWWSTLGICYSAVWCVPLYTRIIIIYHNSWIQTF